VEVEPPSWDVEFAVSKGTYIRALARDLGRACESAAHLGALRRTRSGAIGLAETHTLEELEASDDVTALFADPTTALGLPVLEVDSAGRDAVSNGRALGTTASGAAEGAPVSVVHDGRLIAVYAAYEGMAKPLAVIPGGVSGGSA